MTDPISLTVFEHGPIRVTGPELRLSFAGEDMSPDEGQPVFLCRCGQSSNAPFCDGTHSKVEFRAEDGTLDDKEVRVWEGRTLRTHFNPNACMHAFICKPLKALREAELAGDDDAAAEIARTVMACPSGALTYESKTITERAPADTPDIDIMEGGEIRVQGLFEINADLHARQDPARATLCRCGQSENKPWCDGRHKARKDFR